MVFNIVPSYRWGKRNSGLPIMNKKNVIKVTKTENITFESNAIVKSMTEEPVL